VGGPRCRREGRRVELREHPLDLVEAADQQETPNLEMPRMRGVDAIAVVLERPSRRVEGVRRPAQVARDQRDLRLGDGTPGASNSLSWTERTPGTPQKGPRSNEIAELRHGDPSKRERWRIVSQRDELQSTEGITRGKRTRRSRNQ
jgi:hypothetical protein